MPLLCMLCLLFAFLKATVQAAVTTRIPEGRELRELLNAGHERKTRGLHDCSNEQEVPSLAFDAALTSTAWKLYEGNADVLVGMADPVMVKGTVTSRDDASDEREVILQQTYLEAPHISQITLLDGGSETAGKTFDLRLPAGSEASSAFRTSMRNVPVRGLFKTGDAENEAGASTTTTTMLHDGSSGQMQMETMTMKMTGGGGGGGQDGAALFIMAPELSPPCSSASSDPQAPSSLEVSCTIGGQVQSFENAGLAKIAVVEAIAEGITRVFDEHALPLPRNLRAATTRRRRDRRAYVSPINSLGAERSILFVRSVYFGQNAATVIVSHNDALAVATNATRELNRSAMGATTFTFTLAPQVVTMPATTPLCTSSYTLVETSTKAALLSQLSINGALFAHLVILLPKCASWNFNGLAYVPGSTAWIPLGTDSAYVRTATHECSHNLGANHAGGFDAVTGVFTEYWDLNSPMSSGDNDYDKRDHSAGIKQDFGWLQDEKKVLTLGDSWGSTGVNAGFVCADARKYLAVTAKEVKEICDGALIHLLPSDRGVASFPQNSFEANGDSVFTIRWLHPFTWSSSVADREIFTTYRYRATTRAFNAVNFDEVPLTVGVAGHTALIDVAPSTVGQHDAALPRSSAFVMEAADGRYLIEHVGMARGAGTDALRPDSLEARQKGAVKLRVRKLAADARGDDLDVDTSRGCYGSSCQHDYRSSTVDVLFTCVDDPQHSTMVPIPTTDLGFPTVVRIPASGGDGTLPFPIKARLCIPSYLSSDLLEIALAGYEGDAPLAEILTASPLNRSSAHHLAVHPLVSTVYDDGSVPLPSNYQLDRSCLEVAFFIRPPTAAVQSQPYSYFLLASARYRGGFYPSADAALQALDLEISCIDHSGSSSSTPYGPLVSTPPLRSHVFYRLDFQDNEFFSGVYRINSSRSTFNGALLFQSEDNAYCVGYADGSFYVFTPDLESYFKRQPRLAPAANVSEDIDIASLTTFDGIPFSISRACPYGSVLVQGGCVAAPFGSEARLGSVYSETLSVTITTVGAASVALPRLNNSCFARPGFYLGVSASANADGFKSYEAKPCPANTYKERAGNSQDACVPCPTGWRSNPGSVRCGWDIVPSSSSIFDSDSGKRGFRPCSAFVLRNWQQGWDGTYVLTSSAQGRLVYLLNETASALTPSYAIFEPISGRWVFNRNPTTLSTFFYRVASFRPPWRWAQGGEFESVAFPKAIARCLCQGVAADEADCLCGAGQERTQLGGSSGCSPCNSGLFAASPLNRVVLPSSQRNVCQACPPFTTTVTTSGASACIVPTCGAFSVSWTAIDATKQSLLPEGLTSSVLYLKEPSSFATESLDSAWPFVFGSVNSDGSIPDPQLLVRWTGSRWLIDDDLDSTAFSGYSSSSSSLAATPATAASVSTPAAFIPPWLASAGNPWNLALSDGSGWTAATAAWTCQGGVNGAFGGTTLNDCPLGLTSSLTPSDGNPLTLATTAANCDSCKAGFSVTAGGASSFSCSACPVDTFASSLNASVCQPCPELQTTRGMTGQSRCSCPSGYRLDAYGECIDIDECSAVDQGGCSHSCINTPGGYRCGCPNGMATDEASGGKICSYCAPDRFVGVIDSGDGSGATEACLPCAFGQRRLELPADAPETSKQCGCPLGFLVHKDHGCVRPFVVTVDAAPSDDGISAVAGTFTACRIGGGDTEGGSKLAWQQVERTQSSLFSPSSPLFFSFDGEHNSWSILAGSPTTANRMAARYAYLPSRLIEFTSSASSSFGSSFVSVTGDVPLNVPAFWGSSMPISNVSVLPLGPQSRWNVYRPWPVGFSDASEVGVTIKIKASRDAVVGDETALPLCGGTGEGNEPLLLDALSAPSLMQSGALGRSAGASTVLFYQASGTPGGASLKLGSSGAATASDLLLDASPFVPLVAATPSAGASSSAAATVTQTRLPPLAASYSAAMTPAQTSQPTTSPRVVSFSATATASVGSSPSATGSGGANSASITPTRTSTVSVSRSPSVSASKTASLSRGASASVTATGSPSTSVSPSSSRTSSRGASISPTRTRTPSQGASSSPSPEVLATSEASPEATLSPSPSPTAGVIRSSTATRSPSQTLFPPQLASIAFSFRLYLTMSGMPAGASPSLLRSATTDLCAATAKVLEGGGGGGSSTATPPSSSFTISCSSLTLKGSTSATARELQGGGVPVLTDPTGSCDVLFSSSSSANCKLVGATMIMTLTDPAALITDQTALKALNPQGASSNTSATPSSAASDATASASPAPMAPVSVPASALQSYSSFLTNATASSPTLLNAVKSSATAQTPEEAALMNQMLSSATNFSPSRTQSGSIVVLNATAGPPGVDDSVGANVSGGGGSSDNAGKIAGAVFGSILLVLLILACCYLCIMRSRRRKQEAEQRATAVPVLLARPQKETSTVLSGSGGTTLTTTEDSASSSHSAAASSDTGSTIAAADDDRSALSGGGGSSLVGGCSIVTTSAPDLSGKSFAARRASMMNLGLGLANRPGDKDASSSVIACADREKNRAATEFPEQRELGGTVPRLPSVKGLGTSKASQGQAAPFATPTAGRRRRKDWESAATPHGTVTDFCGEEDDRDDDDASDAGAQDDPSLPYHPYGIEDGTTATPARASAALNKTAPSPLHSRKASSKATPVLSGERKERRASARDLDEEPGTARSNRSIPTPARVSERRERPPSTKSNKSQDARRQSTESAGSGTAIRRKAPPPLVLPFSPAQSAAGQPIDMQTFSLAGPAPPPSAPPLPHSAAAIVHQPHRSARLSLPDVAAAVTASAGVQRMTPSAPPLAATVSPPVAAQPPASGVASHRRQSSPSPSPQQLSSARGGLPPRVPSAGALPPLPTRTSSERATSGAGALPATPLPQSPPQPMAARPGPVMRVSSAAKESTITFVVQPPPRASPTLSTGSAAVGSAASSTPASRPPPESSRAGRSGL